MALRKSLLPTMSLKPLDRNLCIALAWSQISISTRRTKENESHLANHDDRKLQRQPALKHMNLHLCALKGFTLKYADDVDGIQLYRKRMAAGSGNEMGVPLMKLFSLGRCAIALPPSNNKGDE
jgi:hypothetical protein